MIQLLTLLHKPYHVLAFIYFTTGAISCLLALFNLFIIKYSIAKGFAMPCLAAGIVTMILGFTNFSSQVRFSSNSYYLLFITTLIGLIILIFSHKNKNAYWKGFSLGLITQSVLLITLILVS